MVVAIVETFVGGVFLHWYLTSSSSPSNAQNTGPTKADAQRAYDANSTKVTVSLLLTVPVLAFILLVGAIGLTLRKEADGTWTSINDRGVELHEFPSEGIGVAMMFGSVVVAGVLGRFFLGPAPSKPK